METVDWPTLFFDEAADWPGRLMARARRRFGDSPDAEAAYNHALEGLSSDDWQRLRSGYRGTGSAEGFMAITFLNLLEEYAVRKYGRRRAPQWVQRLGPPWTRIYELLCLRRMAPESIVEQLGASEGHAAGDVRRAIREVRGRVPACGEFVGEETVEVQPQPPCADASPAASLEDDELRHLLAVLRALFSGATGDEQWADAGGPVAESVRARLRRLEADLALTARERLLLRLIYQENCTIPAAAGHLDMNERTARRVHGRLMARLREVLARHGMAAT